MKRLNTIIAAALLLAAAGAHSQPGEGTWISLDGSPAGTPPTIQLVAGESGPQRTTVRIDLHGFFLFSVETQAGVFQRIGMPGCSLLRQLGRPMVPQFRVSMAVPTDADTVRVESVNVLQTQVLSGIRVMPSQQELWEYPEGEFQQYESFAYDDSLYAQDTPFPTRRAAAGKRVQSWRGMPIGRGIIQPVRALPATDRLVVDRSLEVTFEHDGTLRPPVDVSLRMEPVFAGLLINYELLDWWRRLRGIEFAGNYLFLVKPEYYTTVMTLAWHKMLQGYDVTVWSTDMIGGKTCEDLRDAVQDWHAAIEEWGDNYVLLVGEHDDLELCYTGYTAVDDDGDETPHYSDYRIGVLEDDLDELYQDLGVGRLSVDSIEDLQDQMAKIMNYENSPPRYTGFYDEIVLAAHPEEGRDYIEACEAVVDWPYYMYPLNFTERYGNAPDGTVDNVKSDVNDGKVIVAYRGHGGSTSWSGWAYGGDSFYTSDVQALTNGSETPVVFSISCSNNGIDKADDCIGEEWMERSEHGAVFHYGSTRGSNTRHNNELFRWIFWLSYGDDHPTLWETTISAQFCAYGLASCSESTSEHTLKQYLILGIPDLKLYQEAPYDILIGGLVPGTLEIGDHHLPLHLQDDEGGAVAKGRVTVFKDGETLVSRYADEAGDVTLDFTLASPGEVTFTVCDDFGPGRVTSHVRSVVEATTDVPQDSKLRIACDPNPFNPATSIRFDLPRAGRVSVRVFDPRGRLVRELLDEERAAGTGAVRWDGTDNRGGRAASGLYFYEVRIPGERQVGKMILTK
jgi:hypothetical protein